MEGEKKWPVRPEDHNATRAELARLSRFERRCVLNWRSRIPLGEEKRKGWVAPIMLYLFWCEWCYNLAKDYTHAHDPYLTCSNCGTSVDFVPLGLMPLCADWALSLIRFMREVKAHFSKKDGGTPGQEMMQDE